MNISYKFNYKGHEVDFSIDGQKQMINATQMGLIFGKKPSAFLRLPRAIKFIERLEKESNVRKSHITFKGNSPLAGTWMEERLALKFAAWLDIDFEFAVYDTINNVKNGEYITIDDAASVFKMINFFKYVDNQRQAEKDNLNKYIEDNGSHKYIYAQFHNWRNKMLNIEPEFINQKIKQYFLDRVDNQNLPSQSNYSKVMKMKKYQKISFLDRYDAIKNAVWDFMGANGQLDLAMKTAKLAKVLAQRAEMEVTQTNETTLFEPKDMDSIEKPIEVVKFLKSA